jgi:hypothetical protein
MARPVEMSKLLYAGPSLRVLHEEYAKSCARPWRHG